MRGQEEAHVKKKVEVAFTEGSSCTWQQSASVPK
jgi:hypothetical protein